MAPHDGTSRSRNCGLPRLSRQTISPSSTVFSGSGTVICLQRSAKELKGFPLREISRVRPLWMMASESRRTSARKSTRHGQIPLVCVTAAWAGMAFGGRIPDRLANGGEAKTRCYPAFSFSDADGQFQCPVRVSTHPARGRRSHTFPVVPAHPQHSLRPKSVHNARRNVPAWRDSI